MSCALSFFRSCILLHARHTGIQNQRLAAWHAALWQYLVNASKQISREEDLQTAIGLEN